MFHESETSTIIVRLLLSLLLSGVLGIEREIKNRPAGMRTYILVCIGSCMIMMTNQYVFQTTGSGDPVRMAAQIVSGIGFLGAGTIIVTRHNQIKGLTTAAGLWAVAAVGISVGVGYYEAAVCCSMIIFIVLTLLNRVDTAMHRNTKNIELYVELSSHTSLLTFMESIKKALEDVKITHVEHDYTSEDGTRAYIVYLKLKRRIDHNIVNDVVRKMVGAAHVDIL